MTKLHEIYKSAPVVVAISGGKNSIAALLPLARLRYNSLIPVHFDGCWDWPRISDVLKQITDVTGFPITTVRPDQDFSW